MAEWLRQGPAKPCTRVRFPLPPRGRLAQWESASLTRKRSQVQILYRPPGQGHNSLELARWVRPRREPFGSCEDPFRAMAACPDGARTRPTTTRGARPRPARAKAMFRGWCCVISHGYGPDAGRAPPHVRRQTKTEARQGQESAAEQTTAQRRLTDVRSRHHCRGKLSPGRPPLNAAITDSERLLPS